MIHGFQLEPGTDGFVLTIAENALFCVKDRRDGWGRDGLSSGPRVIDLTLLPGQAERIAMLMGEIQLEFGWGLPNRKFMLEYLVGAVVLMLQRYLVSGRGGPTMDSVRMDLYARFRTLVEQHYRDQWRLNQFADALGLTESRLNRICRSVVGKSASHVVQDRVLLEARRLLTYTVRPVSAVAYDLGFCDPTYFCRFFRKRTGHSPAKFRSMEVEGALSGIADDLANGMDQQFDR